MSDDASLPPPPEVRLQHQRMNQHTRVPQPPIDPLTMSGNAAVNGLDNPLFATSVVPAQQARTRIAAVLERLRIYKEEVAAARVTDISVQDLLHLASEDVERFDARESGSGGNPSTHPPVTASSTSGIMQAMIHGCGKFNPLAQHANISQFLSKFAVVYESQMRVTPELAAWPQVRVYLLALLEGTAYSFCSAAANQFSSYSDARSALLSRYGKTRSEIVRELFALKQGTQPIQEYLDSVSALTQQGAISDDLVLAMFESNLAMPYRNLLLQKTADCQLEGRSFTVEAASKYLRAVKCIGLNSSASMPTIAPTAPNSTSTSNQQQWRERDSRICDYCGRPGHLRQFCHKRIADEQAAKDKATKDKQGHHFVDTNPPACLPVVPEHVACDHELSEPPPPPVYYTELGGAYHSSHACDRTLQPDELQTHPLLQAVSTCARVVELTGDDDETASRAIQHIWQTTLSEAPSQAVIPKDARGLTAQEMLDRVRISTKLSRYTRVDRNMRTYILHVLLQQHRADDCIICLPPGLEWFQCATQDKYDDLDHIGNITFKRVPVPHHVSTNEPELPGPKRSRAAWIDGLLAQHSLENIQKLVGAVQGPVGGSKGATRGVIGDWWCEGPHRCSTTFESASDYTALGGCLPPAGTTTHHYSLIGLLNGKKITLCLDSGAATSMISLGLANKLGLPVVAHPGTFSTADGTSATFAGKIDNATLALHPEFELKLAYLLVSPSNDYLFLLGNDILRHHPTFSFAGFECTVPKHAKLNLFDRLRGITINVPLLEVPGEPTAQSAVCAVAI